MKLISRLNRSSQNSKIIYKNVFGAFVVKGLSIIVTFLTTPIFIHYFNDNKILGIWYTLLSVLIWFLNFDLGLGNGIRNNLVKVFTEKNYESARRIISSGMFSVGVVTLVLTLIGSLLISLINLNWFFNIKSSVISPHGLLLSTIFVFVAIMLRFFLTTVSSVFYALQKSAVNNFLGLCVSVLQLLYILLAKYDDPEEALIKVSFAYIFLSNIPVVIAGIIVFAKELKQCTPSIKYIDRTHINAILTIGAQFFLCQILFMVIANTNEFFVTKLYGAEFTAEYTFYYKLSSIASMAISLALSPIWSVVTKAQAEGNYIWLNNLFIKIKLAGLLILIVQFLLVPFMPFLMKTWLGNGVVEVNYLTAISFALFGASLVYSGMLSTIANGMAMMKVQTITFTIGVIMKFVLLLILYSITKWDFVAWTNTLILLPYIITQHIWLNRFFRNQLMKK